MPSDTPYDIHPNPAFSPISSSRPSKRKACDNCFRSKAKCDHLRPSCSRCNNQQRSCQYASPGSTVDSISSVPSRGDEETQTGGVGHPLTPRPTVSWQHDGTGLSDNAPSSSSNLNISLRWLLQAPSTEGEGRVAYKSMSRSTRYFCSKFLALLPFSILDEDRSSSLVHRSQLRPVPQGRLANAVTVVRMFRERIQGSEAMMARVISTELESIAKDASISTLAEAVAAFQSFFLLTLLAYYHLPAALSPQVVTLETLVYLQGLANNADSAVDSRDLDPGCHSSRQHVCYILVESLRRTILAACTFDNVWNSALGFRLVTALDLRHLTAPCSARLWEAQDSEVWARLWEEHVGFGGSMSQIKPLELVASNVIKISLQDPGLRLAELWGQEMHNLQLSEVRFDDWLSQTDDFGLWIFAVCEMMGTGRGHKVSGLSD